MSVTKCPLCHNDQVSLKLIKKKKQKYWDCHTCGLIFLDKEFLLTPSQEKARYMTHNNDITDIGYQDFVSPIVDYVSRNIAVGTEGLDYGAGPGPLVSTLLKEMGFKMFLYDPFFWNEPCLLTRVYDFVVTCEVVEHFHSPADEFHKLKNLLKDHGHLVIMTDIYMDSIAFDTWYYHRDPTHVVFYRTETFEWIKDHYGFKELFKGHGRTVILRN